MVNLALNYENETLLYEAKVVPVLVQIIRSAADVDVALQKLGFMALVNLSANDKVRGEIAKLGGVNDAIASASTPSLAQEDAVKLVTTKDTFAVEEDQSQQDPRAIPLP